MSSYQGTTAEGKNRYCAHCGTENPADAHACDRCGERIYLPDPLRPPPLGLVECQNCVTANESRATYCVNCGQSLVNAARISVLNSGEAGRQAPRAQPGIRISQRSRETDSRPPRREVGEQKPWPSERDGEDSEQRRTARDRAPDQDRRRREEARARAGDQERRQQREPEFENNSGTRSADLPQSARGWNAAAFLIGPIWGPLNGVWIGLLGLVFLVLPELPWQWKFLLYLAYGSFLGYRGNVLAWRARRWVSLEQFKRVQQTWMLLSLVVSLVLLIALPILF